jgi:hypothetical protein
VADVIGVGFCKCVVDLLPQVGILDDGHWGKKT